MVYTHGTPYVTPHILHKHYAQAHDAEATNREYHIGCLQNIRRSNF